MSDPNPLGFLQNRRTDEKMEGVRALLSSDKNNETKTRIVTVYGQTVFDMLGAWSSSTDKITVEISGVKSELPKTVEGLATYFGIRYRVNAISKEGMSRMEYVQALSAYLAQQLEMMQTASGMRIEEGVKGRQK